MRLITRCPACKKENRISSVFIETRIDLAKKKGKEFEIKCKNCGLPFTTHVDDIKAGNDLRIPIVGFLSVLLAVFLTALLWDFGFISAATIAIPIFITTTIRNNQRLKINQFNQMYYEFNRFKKK